MIDVFINNELWGHHPTGTTVMQILNTLDPIGLIPRISIVTIVQERSKVKKTLTLSDYILNGCELFIATEKQE